ncbi:MAG: hypothetical protein WAM91_04660, partial [Candidatus Acidiferrales bacterium]
FVLSVAAQSWQQKDWKQWTAADCKELLNSSPWVSSGSSHGSIHRAIIISSLVIREAMLRQEELHHNYEKMSPDQQAAFDKRIAGCLEN